MIPLGGNWDAAIIEDATDWARGTVRLLIASVQTSGAEMLMEDGTWQHVPEGTASPTPVGVAVPRRALPAILRAIEERQGAANHGATEAKVLREALEVERRRVDDVLRERR